MTTHDPAALLDDTLADILGVDSVSDGLSAEICGTWDSANHLRIILTLEEASGVQFSVTEIEEATSREKLLDLLLAKSPSN